MTADLSPDMRTVLSTIGNRSASCNDLGVGGFTMTRLMQLGFLNLDEAGCYAGPAYYSLSEKGKGAAAILTAPLAVRDDVEPIVSRIKRLTAAHFGVPVEEMVSARRYRSVARPRQVAMFLARELSPFSLPTIGRMFGNRDHTTVMHAIGVVECLMSNPEFRHEVETLRELIRCPVNPQNNDKSVEKHLHGELLEAA